MDKNVKILLGSKKHIDAVDVDTHTKIELTQKRAEIQEYDLRSVISEAVVFENEREENEIYRIYGKLNYLSLLNGVKKNFLQPKDFFDRTKRLIDDIKHLGNSFRFYLVKPSKTFTQINRPGSTNPAEYIRMFEVIATPNDINFYRAGFSKNIYEDLEFAFDIDIDFDARGQRDYLGFPMTEIYLYAEYRTGVNITTTRLSWNNMQNMGATESHTTPVLNKGDLIKGDVIAHNKEKFLQKKVFNQTYFITTLISGGAVRWKYNPFIPINLCYFDNIIKTVSKNTSFYEQKVNIPDYAIDLVDNDVVWRDILPQGYINPITGEGVDHPFLNKRRYVFLNEVLIIGPDLKHPPTFGIFKEIRMGEQLKLNITPSGDLDDIGKPCK
jgi:hypothetical protein